MLENAIGILKFQFGVPRGLFKWTVMVSWLMFLLRSLARPLKIYGMFVLKLLHKDGFLPGDYLDTELDLHHWDGPMIYLQGTRLHSAV